MKRKVKKRMTAWKKFFTAGISHVDNHSPWSKILREYRLNYNPSFDDTTKIIEEAKAICGYFTPKELRFLNNIIHFQLIVEFLQNKPNNKLKNLFSTEMFGESICFFPTDLDNEVITVEVFVVSHLTSYRGEVYIFLDNQGASKHIILNYVDRIPERIFSKHVEFCDFLECIKNLNNDIPY